MLWALSPDVVIDVACDVFGADRAELLRGGRGVTKRERHLTLWVCRELCSETNAALGERFGIAGSTVSTAVRRTREQAGDDSDLQAAYAELKRAVAAREHAT